MNINVTALKGEYHAFDLNDKRDDVVLDTTPRRYKDGRRGADPDRGGTLAGEHRNATFGADGGRCRARYEEGAGARCDGPEGAGGELGPAIAPRVGARSDQELLALITSGLPGRGMPAFELEAGGDEGARGFVAAFDPTSGKEVWRFWTVPRPGEPGSETWKGSSIEHPGSVTWMTDPRSANSRHKDTE